VRPLSPVRLLPAGNNSPDMVLTRLQSAFASPPSSARSAPSGSGTFTSRYGSDLLPLRLHSLCSWVARFFGRPNQEVLRNLPDSPTPRTRLPLSRSRLVQAEPFGEVVSPGARARAGSQ
jgi:hypothetical protein